MRYNVVVKEEAVSDTYEAYAFYEQQRTGLGDEFIESLQNRYDQLSENPQYYSFVYADKERTLRDVKLKGFPFVIIYDIIETDVVVYAVHNTSKFRE